MTAFQSTDDIACAIIDQWLSYHVHHEIIPGIQICIRKSGNILFSKAYGVANNQTNEALTTNHVSHLASQSKMVTSCALLQLVESGALQLEDHLITHLPELANHHDSRIKDITLLQLLMHRSGMMRDQLDCNYWELAIPFPSIKEILAEALNKNLVLNPGEKFKYSNFGYALLGIVIERVTKMSYADYVTQKIAPAMQKLPFYGDYRTDIKEPFADGHSQGFYNTKRLPLRHISTQGMCGAGGLCSTCEGSSLFLHEMLLGHKLLSPKMQQYLSETTGSFDDGTKDMYGCGLGYITIEDNTCIGHAGTFLGASSFTSSLKNTPYIISAYVNAMGVNISGIRTSFISILNTTKKIFEQDWQDVTLSPPLYSMWGVELFVAGTEKVMMINLQADTITDINVAHKDKDRFIISSKNPFGFDREYLTFEYDRNHIIKSAMRSGFRMLPEQEFMRVSKINMQG